MFAFPAREKLIRIILLFLILGFFVIPFVALCLFDCKIFPSQKIASLLVFFFR
jgi:hypothetical protein